MMSIPKKQTDIIKKKYGAMHRGWRSLPVEATVGKTKWHTSIFLDNRSGAYILPLKAQVRKKEGIMAHDQINFTIKILA